MNTLLAGGAGFIGSHLADSLIEEGHNVICVDNLYLGKLENIQHLKDNQRFRFYNADLDDFNAVEEIFKKEKIDFVFHLAANSDIQASANSPKIELKNTLLTTFNLLECMRIYNIKNLFFSSTSAVYGEKPGVRLNEKMGPLEPISYYGSAKLASEALISAFTYMNNYHTLVFRFPNIIGSRLTHGVVYDFIKKLHQDNKKLVILGNGTQSKPYMHVSDLIRGIMKFKEGLEQGVTIYNVGVETETSVTKIADMLCSEMGLNNVEYSYTGGNIGWKGDVPNFKYDLDKVHSAGWHATMTSDDAVLRTIKEVLF